MSLADEITRYYAARGPEYDLTAGYADPVAERLRVSIKARYQAVFSGLDVLEIACGTGYWTEVIAQTAKSVLATDINPSLISIARKRLSRFSNVELQVVDAYSLDGVRTGFGAALAIWWWSHIPKSKLRQFLLSLHLKLKPGAFILFIDQLPSAYEGMKRHRDAEGNLLEERVLQDDRKFNIVKNFPSEQEIRGVLRDIAENVRFEKLPNEHSWNVSYNRTD
jgi:demethylmenaquinone methyltransferase/2-methoxy-6-polyprenyl-1,4-benzoquinol methylase